jgi:hypothetical protein
VAPTDGGGGISPAGSAILGELDSAPPELGPAPLLRHLSPASQPDPPITRPRERALPVPEEQREIGERIATCGRLDAMPGGGAASVPKGRAPDGVR